MDRIRIESTITFRCNAVCWGCNKAVGLSSFTKDTEMTSAQMRRAVEQANKQGLRVDKITISGGEPIVNPEDAFKQGAKQGSFWLGNNSNNQRVNVTEPFMKEQLRKLSGYKSGALLNFSCYSGAWLA